MKFYSHISLYFIIWFLVLIFIFYFSFLTLPHSGQFSNQFLRSFANWDGGHFLGIAEYGYTQKFQYAFFPLYPIVINLVTTFTQNYLISAIFISILTTFLGIQIFYRLLLLDFDKKFSEKVIFCLLFFPTSFYLLSVYSEGLFFFLTLTAFYFFRKNNFFLVSVFISLASLTRFVGIALAVAMLFEVLITSGINKKNWPILLSPVGFFIYCFYLYNQLGDPFYFILAEEHWQRTITIPVFSFWETLKSLSESGFISNNINIFLDLIFAILGLGLAIRSFRFLQISYSVFFLVSVLLPLFTSTLSSMPRFLLSLFPMFILVAKVKNKYITFAYQIFSILLLGIFSALFVNGYWVS